MSIDSTRVAGVFYALAAYSMWGVAPLYFKQLSHVDAADILMHRVIWSAVLLSVLLLALNQLTKIREILANRKLVAWLALASVVLGSNWLLFIWAVNHDYLLDASLGYFINPIFNVFIGRLFLNERLRPLQQFAVLLAVIGVVNVVFVHGNLPWIALTLALTFCAYGLIRRHIPVEPLPGLFMETVLLLPFAVLYWGVLASEQSNMFSNGWQLNALLIAAGVVTTVPLLAFNAAAKRILFTTLGLIQYIGPTLMFLLAVWFYQEPLETAKMTTFSLVWLGLVVFSADAWWAFKKQRKAIKDATQQAQRT